VALGFMTALRAAMILSNNKLACRPDKERHFGEFTFAFSGALP
jgi:hypothetical protein